MATKIDSHHRIGQWVCITLINRNRLLLILLLMSMMLLPLLLMMMMPLLLLFDYAFTWVPNEFTTLISYQFPLWCSIKKFIRDTNKHALALMRFANLAWICVSIDWLFFSFISPFLILLPNCECFFRCVTFAIGLFSSCCCHSRNNC